MLLLLELRGRELAGAQSVIALVGVASQEKLFLLSVFCSVFVGLSKTLLNWCWTTTCLRRRWLSRSQITLLDTNTKARNMTAPSLNSTLADLPPKKAFKEYNMVQNECQTVFSSFLVFVAKEVVLCQRLHTYIT